MRRVASDEKPPEPGDLEEFLAETDNVDSESGLRGLRTELNEPAALDPSTGVEKSPEDRGKTP